MQNNRNVLGQFNDYLQNYSMADEPSYLEGHKLAVEDFENILLRMATPCNICGERGLPSETIEQMAKDSPIIGIALQDTDRTTKEPCRNQGCDEIATQGCVTCMARQHHSEPHYYCEICIEKHNKITSDHVLTQIGRPYDLVALVRSRNSLRSLIKEVVHTCKEEDICDHCSN